MDKLPNFETISWCKPDWKCLNITNQDKQLLQQCGTLSSMNLSDDVDEIIERSSSFPIEFPIQTVRLINLKSQRPVERLKRNITSTYPLLHERILILMTKFLEYKRQYGSNIEKAFYKNMTVPELIDRILKKRAVCFVGPRDKYLLLNGESGAEGWEEIGTMEEKPPLVLENCLSYDEMKLSSMVYVSGYTECINDGSRYNKGEVVDNCEQEAVIIGIVGPRFHRRGKMDYEDIIIMKQQNCPENGYGEENKCFLKFFKSTNQETEENQAAKRALRELWADFYQTTPSVYKESMQKEAMDNDYTEKYVHLGRRNFNSLFDNEVYYKRIRVIAETTLIEAEHRAKECGRDAFVNVVGCGLGVWLVAKHQPDVYVLTFLERIKAFLSNGMLDHVTDINFAYIKGASNVLDIFQDSNEATGETKKRKLLLKSETHPKGGINIYMENREPSARLTGEHEGKLLVLTYPWDSNAHPGNEFWFGSLHTSGDPAAACSTQVSELHNAHINPAVNADNARVAGRDGLRTLSDYCLALSAQQ